MQGAFGIWIDFGNQGTRISRNLIYDTQAATVFLEMNHGPAVVDSNILAGKEVLSNSEATVFAHNLFVDCPYVYRPDTGRRSAYYKPHTTIAVGRKTGTAQDDKWYGNIFVRTGLDTVKNASGYVSNYNVFLEGAGRSAFGDEQSVVDPSVTGFAITGAPQGATVTISVPDTLFSVKPPQVNAAMVGVFPTVGQTIEDRYGKPITVDTDFTGARFTAPVAGPLADLRPGKNSVGWLYRQAP
jgi:hypothetical protein